VNNFDVVFFDKSAAFPKSAQFYLNLKRIARLKSQKLTEANTTRGQTGRKPTSKKGEWFLATHLLF